jgi:hypothetical protein
VKDIIQLLLARLRSIPGITEAQVFNNQLQHLDKLNIMGYPLVLIELLDIQYEAFMGGTEVQYGTAEVRIHVVGESITQGEDFGIYEVKSLVHQYLHRFDGSMFNGLVRTQETLDTDHDNLYDYQLTYTFRFAEETRPLPSEDTADFPFNYALSGDL